MRTTRMLFSHLPKARPQSSTLPPASSNPASSSNRPSRPRSNRSSLPQNEPQSYFSRKNKLKWRGGYLIILFGAFYYAPYIWGEALARDAKRRGIDVSGDGGKLNVGTQSDISAMDASTSKSKGRSEASPAVGGEKSIEKVKASG